MSLGKRTSSDLTCAPAVATLVGVFDHVTIRVSNRAASERFYDTVLAQLGRTRTHTGKHYTEWDDFGIAADDDHRPVTRRLHLGFGASSPAQVDAFWQAGLAAGHQDDGAPRPRPQYRDDYYGAFLLDPDGNSAEAMHHGAVRTDGAVDHLWLRVADVAASTAFYTAVAAPAGLRVKLVDGERTQLLGASGSFSVVRGEPTEHAHLAFPAGDRATVDSFHATALAAGYASNGAPGERAEYHAGYYGAFVLDPDGSNVEVVYHDRA